MENEENLDLEQVTQDEELDLDLSTDETESTEEQSTDETTEQKLAKAEAEANKWRRLAQKNQKKPEVVRPKVDSKPSPVSVDERILKSQGMTEDLIEELKVIAEIRGLGLIEAQTDHLFVATKEKYERDQQARRASLGSSRGSGQPAPKKGLDTPNLSRDEHKELMKAELAKL